MKKEFLSYCYWNFVFEKKNFLSQNFVCVCVSEFLVFLSASSQCTPISFFKDIICSYYT